MPVEALVHRAEMAHAPVVVWVTGLPASGKTSLAAALLDLFHVHGRAAIHLDGDELRGWLAADLGYDREDRLRASRRYVALAELLHRHGRDVVVSTVSMFEGIRRGNRARFARYYEIYLEAPEALRRTRDERGVYRGLGSGEYESDLELPTRPDLVLPSRGGALRQSREQRIVARAVRTWSVMEASGVLGA